MSFAARHRPAAPTESHPLGAVEREGAALPPAGDADGFVDEMDPDTLTPAQSRCLRRALDDLAAQGQRRHGH